MFDPDEFARKKEPLFISDFAKSPLKLQELAVMLTKLREGLRTKVLSFAGGSAQ